MIKAILSDFSRVIVNVKDKNYKGSLNNLYRELAQKSDFSFDDYYEFNDELLSYFQKIKKLYSLNIFTSGSIQKDSSAIKARISPLFDTIFSSIDIGFAKTDPRGYFYLAKKLSLKSEEILFIDDQRVNIEAAKTAGLKTLLYESNETLFSDLQDLSIF